MAGGSPVLLASVYGHVSPTPEQRDALNATPMAILDWSEERGRARSFVGADLNLEVGDLPVAAWFQLAGW